MGTQHLWSHPVPATQEGCVKKREKFATQVSSEILALVDEAFADQIEKHKNPKPRAHVMKAHLKARQVWPSLQEAR
jgi:hypothetical protein